ncbi:uncharacterized protein LOC131208297 [Anopheles bellator]|uniref:uncharacterized protein LOC131208297 n=1 Tax=Anopheles bellator TaxID=139047 RepID=UPI0026474A96|nr:uncharacterized protein LOC131208297 [Anopheles bellator]
MDLLKKFMGLDGRKDDDDDNRKKKPSLGDEFRKPIWVEEDDSDDELFDNQKLYGVQIFTSPLEMQKHYERQMQDMLKSLEQYDESTKLLDRDLKEDFLKPGFEDAAGNDLAKCDTDLDGVIYADQLHSLLQRISPEWKDLLSKQPKNETKSEPNQRRKPLSDEEKIMDWIHGIKEQQQPKQIPPATRRNKASPSRFHDVGIFEGAFQGPRMFGQSIISQTIRRPDGSYETRRTVRDSEGNTQTTITLATKDGRKETITTGYEGADDGGPPSGGKMGTATAPGALLALGDKFALNNGGYVLPKNLW